MSINWKNAAKTARTIIKDAATTYAELQKISTVSTTSNGMLVDVIVRSILSEDQKITLVYDPSIPLEEYAAEFQTTSVCVTSVSIIVRDVRGYVADAQSFNRDELKKLAAR